VLERQAVGYALRRARRRSIGFSVGPEGLAVAAPRWVGIGDVEAALQAKARWIVGKLHEQSERSRRLQAARIPWGEGATLPFLGRPLVLLLDARVSGVMLDAADAGQQLVIQGVAHTCLRVGLPQGAEPAQIRDAVQGWLQRQAIRIFTERAAHFAQVLKVRVTSLKLSSAQTRWGSASADGTVRLNWRLVHFALPTIDYVVAHELAHLRHMDHSPRFWDVVRSVVPDMDEARGRLKDELLPPLD
jgi:predicted metal-dependent hydrolase